MKPVYLLVWKKFQQKDPLKRKQLYHSLLLEIQKAQALVCTLIHIFSSFLDGKWQDEDCAKKMHYVCMEK